MTNQCPICQAPIRKNAKHCTRHSIQRDLDYKDTLIVQASHTATTRRIMEKHAAAVAKARCKLHLQSLRPRTTETSKCSDTQAP